MELSITEINFSLSKNSNGKHFDVHSKLAFAGLIAILSSTKRRERNKMVRLQTDMVAFNAKLVSEPEISELEKQMAASTWVVKQVLVNCNICNFTNLLNYLKVMRI